MIEIQDLWKSYNGIQVIKGLSLRIPPKQTTVILGRSGVGKSVLLRQILGLETPDQGNIIIKEKPLHTLSYKERHQQLSTMGMLFQSSALFDSMSIEENIAFPLIYHRPSKIPKDEIPQAIDEALTKVDLEGFQKKFPSELSGGQKRRAALARLIVYKPEILLFDEPTTGLDPLTASQIADLIVETQKNLESTVIVVTHDIVSALRIGHYFAFHDDGVIRISGEKEQFFSSHDPHLHSFLSSALLAPHDIQCIHQEGAFS